MLQDKGSAILKRTETEWLIEWTKRDGRSWRANSKSGFDKRDSVSSASPQARCWELFFSSVSTTIVFVSLVGLTWTNGIYRATYLWCSGVSFISQILIVTYFVLVSFLRRLGQPRFWGFTLSLSVIRLIYEVSIPVSFMSRNRSSFADYNSFLNIYWYSDWFPDSSLWHVSTFFLQSKARFCEIHFNGPQLSGSLLGCPSILLI